MSIITEKEVSELKEKILKLSNDKLETLIKSLWYDISVNFLTRGTIESKFKKLTYLELITLADENSIDLKEVSQKI